MPRATIAPLRLCGDGVLAARADALIGVAHDAAGAAFRDLFLPRFLLLAVPILFDPLGLFRPAQLRGAARVRLSSRLPVAAPHPERMGGAGRRPHDLGSDPAR